MIELRDYQKRLEGDIYQRWREGSRAVLAALPTGGGKTALFSKILQDHRGGAIAIAHRKELVSQMSLTLAGYGVRHRIIAPNETIRDIVNAHMLEFGRPFYDATAHIAVAGVDTLIRRGVPASFADRVTLWVQDEAHHVLRENKWGRAIELFPNALGLGVTATPERTDGLGLGRHADGVFDALVEGPSPADLIEMGYLTPYRIFAPASDIDLSDVPISTATGDFSLPSLRKAVHRSRLVGDVVSHYLKLAAGKLGVTFCVSIEECTATAQAYRDAGVPAEVVSSETPDAQRIEIIRRFRRRELLQLVNVDLFGEGFNLPAIEVVSKARPTTSFGLNRQQDGRALRPMPGKTEAILIDHVSNWTRHGAPDTPRSWSLDRREKRGRSSPTDVPLLQTCVACTAVFERYLKTCPMCGHTKVPADRSGPEKVDGDLTEVDPALLAQLRGEIARIDGPARIPSGVGGPAGLAIVKRHRERQQAQASLRSALAWWGGLQQSLGRTDDEAYRRFYLTFGIDVMTAQTLGAREAEALEQRVRDALKREGVVTDE